ncbi:NUDIX domain-containing protein [Candidatus Kaiserbacteria bacterium]|nr:NUDIX domain-containing protein [Candidatus Kaiserbacteria bacterium]
MSKDQKKATKLGVGVLIQNDLGQVLLGLRIGSHAAGDWGAPGGSMEFGDSISETAAKETLQETGLHVTPLRMICVCEEMGYIESDGKHFVDIGVLARYNGGEPCIMEPDKCREWRWFDLDQLPPNLMESTDYMIRNFQEGVFHRPFAV